MKRLIVFTAFLLTASLAFAQVPAPAKPPRPPAAPSAAPAAPATPPAAPAPPAAAPVAPPLPPPPPAPPRGGQPINVKVELTISEDGGSAAPIKKTVTAVVGDGFNGYVRERGVQETEQQPGVPRPAALVAPLNLDAAPTILPNGKIRLSCTIQYTSNQRPGQDRQINTDIKQSLILTLESGKTLTISEATDPISDRRVKVDVTATILK